MVRKHESQSSSDSTKPANKERVRFIFEPDRHSPNGITFTWLIHKTYNGKEKAAIATRAFWLPFAYRDHGNSSEAELRELAQQSIWTLEEQIQYLRETFGLEAAPRPIAPTVVSQTAPLEAILQGRGSANASTNVTPEPAEAPVDAIEGLNLAVTQDLLDEFSEVI
jgi:hypothetical protein